MNITKKTFVGDILINITAAALPVAVLNIIVYPLLASHIPADRYGTLTTCVGLINMVNGIWGSSVAYTRLLDKSEGIIKNNYTLVLVASIVLAIAMNIAMLAATGCMMADISIPMISICVALIIVNNYLVVEYRLILSYYRILLSNVLSCVGYAVGIGIMTLTGYSRWEVVFCFGYGFSAIYNLATTRLWRIKPKVDQNLRSIVKSTCTLNLSSTIAGMSTYLDKLLIYPLLGATAMAYFQTASIVAKIVPLFASAISNVILSYLVKIEKITKKTFLIFFAVLSVISLVGLVVCDAIVPPLIKLLYPMYYEHCVALIPFANIIAVLQMFYSFAYPLSLRYANRSKQYYIQLGRLIPYVVLALLFISKNGLIGFSYACIISQIIQIVIVVYVSSFAIWRGNENRSD